MPGWGFRHQDERFPADGVRIRTSSSTVHRLARTRVAACSSNFLTKSAMALNPWSRTNLKIIRIQDDAVTMRLTFPYLLM